MKCPNCNRLVKTVYIRKKRKLTPIIVGEQKLYYCETHRGFTTPDYIDEVQRTRNINEELDKIEA